MLRRLTLALLPALVLSFAACSSPGVHVWTAVERDGPPFAESFPDPAVLLSTRDVRGVRKVLANTPLPETDEHHEALLALVNEAPTIDTDHLLLISEAVAIPGRISREAVERADVAVALMQINGRTPTVVTRGGGEFAQVLDDILIAGAEKLSDPDAENLGRLLGATQFSATMERLCDPLLKRCDDGSEHALREMLEGIPFDDQRSEFLLSVLLPRGHLPPARQELALDSLSFDSNKTELVLELYDGARELDPDRVLRDLGKLSFDSSRSQVVNAAARRLGPIDRATTEAFLANASFDSSRTEMMMTLQPLVRLDGAEDVLALMQTCSYDSNREELLDLMLAGRFPKVSPHELADLVSVADYDSSRRSILDKVAPYVGGPMKPAEARCLLESFSFDESRLHAVRLFADDIRRYSADEKRELVQAISFSSNREEALFLLL